MVWKVNTYNHITEIEPGETIPRVVATVVRKEDMPMIAAATEMYEALKAIHEQFGYSLPETYKELIEKALQKARGEGE